LQIPQSALSSLTIVQRIDLAQNSITELSRGALGRLPVLFNLDLSYNAVTSIEEKAFDGLLQLQELNLANNNISRLVVGCFSSLVSLKVMNLSNNEITKTENGTQCVFEENLSLETLDLSYNRFTSVTPLTFPSKEWTPYRLSSIDLSHNLLSSVTKDFLHGTKILRRLNLASNRISDIRPFVIGNLSSLVALDLSNNNIGYLDAKGLRPPLNLEELNLSGNRLRKFPMEILPKAPLGLINLMENHLPHFDPEFIPKIQNGSRVLLNKNPMACDCRLVPLVRFFNDFRPNLSNNSISFYKDILDFECNFGRGNVSRLIMLREGDLQCDYTKDYLAPRIPSNYDLEIRTLEQRGKSIEIRWGVRSKEDITGFRLRIEGQGEESLWTKTYKYNVRSARVSPVPGSTSICIRSITTTVEGVHSRGLEICQPVGGVGDLLSSPHLARIGRNFPSLPLTMMLLILPLTSLCLSTIQLVI